jgi:hypothetical protein
MWFRCLAPPLFWLSLGLVLLSGCASVGPAKFPAGITLTIGTYISKAYRAPDFDPVKAGYVLKPFNLVQAKGIDPAVFKPIFAAELAKAWDDNGLQLSPKKDALTVSGDILLVRVRGGHFRFLLGQIYSTLVVSGTVRRGDQVLFAFEDHIDVSSPILPGKAAPREKELLLRQACKEFARHLLNELLLQGKPAG